MITIMSVDEHARFTEIAAAQALFRRYAEFLRSISACHGFDFERFAGETADLPVPYAGHGGELLLAVEDDADGTGAQHWALGCVAYRAAPASLVSAAEDAPIASDRPGRARACELKRLFVAPEARGRQLGPQLVHEALRRAARRGYRTAVLDTEPSSMQAAHRIYIGLGFTEFQPPAAAALSGGPKVIYLRRALP